MKKLSEFPLSDAVIEVALPREGVVLFRVKDGPLLFGLAVSALLDLAYDLVILFRSAHCALPEPVEHRKAGPPAGGTIQ
jgi:hypothetical protein